MPFAQFVTSGIELAFNQLLKLDPDSQLKMKKLTGRSLQISIREFPWPLIFSFSDQVDVGIVESPPDSDTTLSQADCLIELNLETLPKLKDSSQITQLIQQQQLNLIGDIYVAQTFSALIKELDIDWEEQLSKYTGDVFAHQTFSTMRSIFEEGTKTMKARSAELSERLTQEGSIAVKPEEVSQFSESVSALRSDTERLLARVSLLEQTQQEKRQSNLNQKDQTE